MSLLSLPLCMSKWLQHCRGPSFALCTSLLTILCLTLPLLNLATANDDLTALPMTELMELEVTSASRRTKTVAETSAAIYVISADDIHRTGATTVPDLLRTVPGLMVAQIDASKWAVSSRSFNSLFSDKLLVLVDGRSTYNPLFASTNWDTIAPPLDEIDRIEIIRGPGGTLWGANAVNGVINIITKSAHSTQGLQASLAAGNQLKDQTYLRYGGTAGSSGAWRLQLAQREQNANHTIMTASAADDWRLLQGRGRLDLNPQGRSSFTLDGELYSGSAGFNAPEIHPTTPWLSLSSDDRRLAGGHLLGRWTQKFPATSQLTVQTYYDRSSRSDRQLKDTRDTLDFDLQNDLSLLPNHETLWGLGYRYTRSDTRGSFTLAFDPERQLDRTCNIFFQDDWSLFDQHAVLTLGSRFERTSYTPFEWEPNLRLLVVPHPELSLWASVTRAVRTPARFDREVEFYTPARTTPTLLLGQVHGDAGFDSEKVWAFELGARTHLAKSTDLDVTIFYNRYSDLRSFNLTAPIIDPAFSPAQPVIQGTIGNDLAGESHGAEISLSSEPLTGLRLKASYTYFNRSLKNSPISLWF